MEGVDVGTMEGGDVGKWERVNVGSSDGADVDGANGAKCWTSGKPQEGMGVGDDISLVVVQGMGTP